MLTEKMYVYTKPKKRCLIIGDTTSNVGDLLLRCQLLEIMSAKFKRNELFSIEWKKNPDTSSIIQSYGATPLSIRQNFTKIMLVAINSEVLIGPGQIMRDNQSLYCILTYLFIAIIARLSGGLISLHGIGIGRLTE